MGEPLAPTFDASAQPRVTIVVITWNRRSGILATLPRLLALPEAAPIIVVDNGSVDGTADAVRASYPQVEVRRLVRNREAAGRNVGVAIARTPYVAFSDDDSWWEPGALRRATEMLDSHPRLAVLAATVLVGEGGPPDRAVDAMRHSTLPAETDLPGTPVLGFIACGAVVRRSAYLSVGGFNPLMGVGGEETLLAVDLAEAGWGLAHVPEVVAVHSPSRLRDHRRRRRRVVRNRLWQSWLRRPWTVAFRTTVEMAVKGRRDIATGQGVLDALRGAPSVLRQRHRISADVERRLRLIDGFD